jgi:hypothetical protein
MPIYPAPEEEKSTMAKANVIGDDPLLSKEQLKKQTEDDRLKAEKLTRKAIQKAIDENMNKHKVAFQDTMYEIAHGKPRVKAEKGGGE